MSAGAYERMALAERCNSFIDARQAARVDEESGTRQPAFARDDPRFAAYLSERCRIRAAAGKSQLR